MSYLHQKVLTIHTSHAIFLAGYVKNKNADKKN